jgi:hypothetical protein
MLLGISTILVYEFKVASKMQVSSSVFAWTLMPLLVFCAVLDVLPLVTFPPGSDPTHRATSDKSGITSSSEY